MPATFLHGIEVTQVDDGLRPVRTVKSSVIGLVGTAPNADAALFPADQPVLVTGPRMAQALGAGGTLKDAYDAIYAQGVNIAVIVRVEEGADAAATQAAVVGDATAGTGVWALMAAGSMTGQVPRILAAPGHTTTDPNTGTPPNPVTVALLSVAESLRAIVVADGPNVNEAAALAEIAPHGSDRLFMVDPAVRVFDTASGSDVVRPASGYVAGVISATDAAKGFWWSPSNREVRGITGTARPVPFKISSDQTETHRLNAAGIATIVREHGFRVWGNRTPSADPLWAFLSVRRTADMIYESIEAAHLWAMDRPFSAQLLLDIRDSVQAYLNSLISRGALLGGRVWLDPELNTEASLKAGELWLDFDIEPPAPLEHLIFRAHREGSYYEELVADVVRSS